MTKEEFLNDTINHFNSKNRSEVDGACKYAPAHVKSQGCAIGRFIPPNIGEKFDNGGNDAIDFIFDKLRPHMPKWMAKMSPDFLADIQMLHDDRYYWDDKGISLSGLTAVRNIVAKHSIDASKIEALNN